MTSLKKCSKNKMIFGVCCGISNSTGIDITFVRFATVIGTLFTGSLLFWIYLLLAVIMPSDQD